jgi:uncharacterized protein
VTFYIQVPSIDNALASVKEAGGAVAMEKATVPGSPTLAQFTDPAGHLIGLIEG